jgi:hypothetical protein
LPIVPRCGGPRIIAGWLGAAGASAAQAQRRSSCSTSSSSIRTWRTIWAQRRFLLGALAFQAQARAADGVALFVQQARIWRTISTSWRW